MDDPFDPWPMPEVPNKLDALWKSRTFGWLLILAAFLLFAWWQFHVPTPGKAVAALAVAAAVMSLRPEATGLERTAWVLVLCGFLYVELRTIDKDRSDSARQQGIDRQQEDSRFDGILKANRDQFDATMKRAGMIQQKTEDAANLSKQNLENITGADSYAWVTPKVTDLSINSSVPLAIHNYGPHTLSGVTVHVFDLAAFDHTPFDITAVLAQEYQGPNIEVGTLVSGQTRPLPYLLPSISMNSGTHMYRLEMTAQSGEVEELIQFRPNQKDGMLLAYRITVAVREQPLPNGRFTKQQPLESTGWSDEGFKNIQRYYRYLRRSSP